MSALPRRGWQEFELFEGVKKFDVCGWEQAEMLAEARRTMCESDGEISSFNFAASPGATHMPRLTAFRRKTAIAENEGFLMVIKKVFFGSQKVRFLKR
jgi:hypothetical protein